MPLTLPGNGGPPPGVRRPEAAVRFGGAAGGGVGALAAAVGGALGVAAADDPWKRSVLSVTVELGIAPSVDSVEVELSGDSQAPTVTLGDAGSVSLGYADGGPVLVLTGTVDAARRRLSGPTRLVATNGGAALSRLRLNQSYEQQSAGDLVRDLAGRAGVSTGSVESGVSLPFFVVDDRRSAYAHLAALAQRSGHLAYHDPEGKLCFVAATLGEPVRTFHHAVDVLSVELLEGAAEVGAATVWGEGAAGSQGQDAWCWLVKDPAPVTGSAGSGTPAVARADRALRSAEAVGGAATALVSAGARRKLTGRLRSPGAPEVTVGATIEIADAPTAAMNGRFLVTGVRHRLAKGEGFVSEILFSAPGSGGGLP